MVCEGIDIIVLLICLSEVRSTVGWAISGQVSHFMAVVALVVVLASSLWAFAGEVAELAAVEALVLTLFLLLLVNIRLPVQSRAMWPDWLQLKHFLSSPSLRYPPSLRCSGHSREKWPGFLQLKQVLCLPKSEKMVTIGAISGDVSVSTALVAVDFPLGHLWLK